MTFTDTSCVEIRCDDCGRAYGNDDVGTAHFGSRAEAITSVTDGGFGSVVTGERALCRDCVQRQACRLTGHDWPHWRDAGQVPTGEVYVGRWRYCLNCWERELDPLLPPAAPPPSAEVSS